MSKKDTDSKELTFGEVLNKGKTNDKTSEAIKALIIGCRLAQEKGVYTLEEARTIMNAIDFLNSDK